MIWETLHKVGAMDKASLYQSHLERVSRSFAFCIAQLKSPLREWVGLSYILCRLVDTVEDSRWPDKTNQLEAFSRFSEMIEKLPAPIEVEAWVGRFPTQIPDGERLLLQDSLQFFTDLHALPQAARQAVQSTVLNMTRGMEYFCRQSQGCLRLENGHAANQYCFFVAGVIGELLTKLLELTTENFQMSTRMLVDSFHFGLYLQKINLLKDQMVDQKEGRYLVFSREQMMADLRTNARRALEYLKAIPLSRTDYRLFCAWSLFLGLISIPWIEKSWNEGRQMKISRTETFLFLGKVQVIVNDNAALENLFNEYIPEKPEQMQSQQAFSGIAWFQQTYCGELEFAGMRELGLA